MVGDGESSRGRSIAFGPFRFRPSERILERSGRSVRLGGRALDILTALLERPGEVVAQRDLNARVWPNIYVSDATLRVQIRALRKALDDGVGGARYVANIPGRGYCFVAPVEYESTEPPSDAGYDPALDQATPNPCPTNLPRRLGRLIGRGAELVELDRLVSQNRLVTIAGAGGIGKSRLSLDVGWRASSRFPEGVWLVDLAPLTKDDVVVSAAAAAISARIRDLDDPAEGLAEAIGNRRMLLIFDNCERVVGAIAELIEVLLRRAPRLSVLVTSQGTIGVASELIYRLAPLAVPPAGITDIVKYGAAEFFVERARETDRRFALDADTAKAVALICRRLDGIPLALEMAAARLPLLGLEGLRVGLDKRLRMLTADLPVGVGRHATLRAMVEWSHSLLDPETEVVFRRLAIFPGSFSLEAAVAVTAGPQGDYWDGVDSIGRLVNKALVMVEPCDPPRYRLLETLRLFALERLAVAHEETLVRERHAKHFLNLLGGAYSAWETRTEEECLSAFGSEIDNVRTALDWALAEPERTRLAIGLAGAAGLLWESLGLYSEARDYLEAALSRVDPNSLDAAVARLWLQSAIAWRYVDPPRAKSLLEQSVSLSQTIDEPLILASAQARLGGVLTAIGQCEAAIHLLTTAQVVFSASNYPISEIGCIINLGIIEMQRRNFNEAERLYKNGLSIARSIGRYSHVSTMLSFLSGLAFAKGNVEYAIDLAQQAVEILKSNNSQLDLVARLTALAVFSILGGKPSEARGAIKEALALYRQQGGSLPLSTVQAGALLLAFEGETAAAARLIGFVDHRYAATRATRQPAEQRTYFALIAMLGETLSADEIRTFAAEGAGWIEEQAFDLLLRDGQAPSARLARSTASN